MFHPRTNLGRLIEAVEGPSSRVPNRGTRMPSLARGTRKRSCMAGELALFCTVLIQFGENSGRICTISVQHQFRGMRHRELFLLSFTPL